jgi:ABC-type Na+ transport system ATPase subunit NatA
MIAVAGLSKSYGAHLALDGVSFVARNGVVTGLLGPTRRRQDNGAASRDGRDSTRSRFRRH